MLGIPGNPDGRTDRATPRAPGEAPAPPLGVTRSTSGGEFGVSPGMVNTPASSGVTLTMVMVDSRVMPLMI